MLFGARLGRLTKKDPTIEDQVMAVAATLVVKKRLEGDEVEAIMRSHCCPVKSRRESVC